MDTLTIVFLTFLPCIVIAVVAIAIHLILRILPANVTRFLQFNLTNPGDNRPPEHKPKSKVSHSYRTDPKNRELQSQLMTLLRGDVATGKRLLRQQRQNNPGKSDNWYLEKVIYDLERDRGR
ncbi:hypothetical protein [Calothrix sp. PCC 7507]|uniref:hypothetical protein n=1 Tax=Calothrix sp. PCC 7507 TaxID=99598 RepID=UPI00029ED912|nr:hypothetical protein [Calothrix sp. PCC 7507]AFY31613.1 hypothetical protein Cal7507_1139 [Calothrix sp. PCC 7507]